MFSIFGEAQLESITSNATPTEVATWKTSTSTKSCYKKLFEKIDPNDQNSPTHMSKILVKVWPNVEPSKIKAAYAVSVCQIMLNERYEKLTMSEDIVKKRLNKNLV
jgi:hypothetical protein